MAPDKIFLVTPSCASEQDKPFWSEEEWQGAISVEYIRKDALLEWLKKEYETSSWYYEKMKHVTGCIGDTGSSGRAEAYKKVIEKIESL